MIGIVCLVRGFLTLPIFFFMDDCSGRSQACIQSDNFASVARLSDEDTAELIKFSLSEHIVDEMR